MRDTSALFDMSHLAANSKKIDNDKGRKVKLTVSGDEDGDGGYLREATQDDGLKGNIYKVPIFRATLSGIDDSGNEQNYQFYVVRVGVKNGVKTSLKVGSYSIDKWDSGAIGQNGGWHIKNAPTNNYYLHVGSSRFRERFATGGYMANYGCIAFCFAENGVENAFDSFADKVLALTGLKSRELVGANVSLTVEIEKFNVEPVIEKVGTFTATIEGKNRTVNPKRYIKTHSIKINNRQNEIYFIDSK